jgi:hypothetical protein
MYSLTPLEGTLLTLAVLGVTALLVTSVLAGLPRALQTVSAGVHCPLAGRTVMADLVRDVWTLRFVDVRRCALLGERFAATCSKGCLSRCA